MDLGSKNYDFRKIAASAGLTLVILAGFALLQPDDKDEGTDINEFNRNDVMFMNMMIVHHDQAIEMAELSESRSGNENILELSGNISEAQTRENQQMTEWMNQLGYSAGNHHPMAGMASEEEMQQLRNSKDSEFDQLFAELMIEHHRGGIAMAQNFREAGENPELREMQRQMIEAQKKEIEKMQQWREQDSL